MTSRSPIPPREHAGRVLRNTPLGAGCWSLLIDAPEIAAGALAGQFVMVGIEAGLRPYLKRAFSVADVHGDAIEILGKTVGPGTAALGKAAEGSDVAVLGPLGVGFTLDRPERGAVALVAGGIGVAPMVIAARELAAAGTPAKAYFGGRTAADLVAADRLGAFLGETNVVLATDDGSRGRAGRVTAALAEDVDAGVSIGRVLACGPEPMFVALEKVTRERNIAAEMAMEREMACGFGVCLGCVVPGVEGGFFTLCKEGPCVPRERIDWSRL